MRDTGCNGTGTHVLTQRRTHPHTGTHVLTHGYTSTHRHNVLTQTHTYMLTGTHKLTHEHTRAHIDTCSHVHTCMLACTHVHALLPGANAKAAPGEQLKRSRDQKGWWGAALQSGSGRCSWPARRMAGNRDSLSPTVLQP